MDLDENEETASAEDRVEESSDSANKKRVNEDTDKSTKKSSCKKAKKVIKEEDSIVLKRLIRELSSDTTRISEIQEKKGLHRESVREVEDSRIFFLSVLINNPVNVLNNIIKKHKKFLYYVWK